MAEIIAAGVRPSSRIFRNNSLNESNNPKTASIEKSNGQLCTNRLKAEAPRYLSSLFSPVAMLSSVDSNLDAKNLINPSNTPCFARAQYSGVDNMCARKMCT